ncbi:MAG: hypothetical protein ACYC3S_01165 [Chloroflexota bacterium]
MEELKDLIASVVAYLAKRQREETSEYADYAYVPVRVRVHVDERDDSDGSVSWRMY